MPDGLIAEHRQGFERVSENCQRRSVPFEAWQLLWLPRWLRIGLWIR
jgi:hypothetical protein